MPTDSLPTGVLQITVFDAAWVPVAERVLFINNNLHTFYPSVKMFTPRLFKRAKNTIDIVVEDTLLSNLSVSVTDINAVQDKLSSIKIIPLNLLELLYIATFYLFNNNQKYRYYLYAF